MFACYSITADSYALALAEGSWIALGACRQRGLRFGVISLKNLRSVNFIICLIVFP